MRFKFKGPGVIVSLLVWAGFGTAQLSAATEYEIAQNEAQVAEQQKSPDTQGEEKKSKWGNFLALPIVITEPAIGEGLGASLIYFHGEKDEKDPRVTRHFWFLHEQ